MPFPLSACQPTAWSEKASLGKGHLPNNSQDSDKPGRYGEGASEGSGDME